MTIHQAYIAGTGMITPVGGNVELNVIAVKAGMNCYVESPHVNGVGYKMKYAEIPAEALPPLNEELDALKLHAREKRCIRMAAVALQESLDGVEDLENIPLFLGLPESIPGYNEVIQSAIVSHIAKQSAIEFDVKNSRVYRTGRVSGIHALELAFQYFESTGNSRVIIGGVDSFIDPNVLGVLDLHGRVLHEQSLEAFAPGEGAAFLLLTTDAIKEKASNKGTQVFRPATQDEAGHRYSDEPNLGEGLTAVFKRALLASGNEKPEKIFSSFNGESTNNKEYGVAVTRNIFKLSENFDLEHPADCFGDVGAAFAPSLIILAHHNVVGKSLIFCCSDNAPRGAVAVKSYG